MLGRYKKRWTEVDLHKFVHEYFSVRALFYISGQEATGVFALLDLLIRVKWNFPFHPVFFPSFFNITKQLKWIISFHFSVSLIQTIHFPWTIPFNFLPFTFTYIYICWSLIFFFFLNFSSLCHASQHPLHFIITTRPLNCWTRSFHFLKSNVVFHSIRHPLLLWMNYHEFLFVKKKKIYCASCQLDFLKRKHKLFVTPEFYTYYTWYSFVL